MPQERIFTMKEGTEFPKSFAGATIPINATESLAEQIAVAGGSPEFVAAVRDLESKLSDSDRKVRDTQNAVFNQSHVLNVQKSVKQKANEKDATVPSLREHAANFKYGTVRVRSGNAAGGATKVKPQTVEKVLGQDLLATFTPEQRKLYEAQMAALRPKVAEATAGATNQNAAQPQPTANAGSATSPTGNRKRR